jgi:iron(III) transport system substrate-binding protein
MQRTDAGARKPRVTPAVALVLVIGAAVIVYTLVWGRRERGLTVYCAHDSVYSESVLRDFEAKTGIPVRIKFDTEATKSLGLVELILKEKDNPVCDVFWNNEVFGTMELQRREVLESYKGPGYERIPARFKEPDGYWTGFGGRFRVWIVNTNAMEPAPEAVNALLETNPERVAIAKPLYGTTFTHYTVLWSLWGEDRLKEWHHSLRKRGVAEVLGNSTVKNAVAEGTCDAGFTDTDDAFVAVDAGKPVTMLPVRVDNGNTICIPNTVAIIKGTKHMDEARKLVDFLLSVDCEVALANSQSHQVPLGPVPADALPPDVRAMTPWVVEGVDLTPLDASRQACLTWLKSEY